jgi:hypothetical protein
VTERLANPRNHQATWRIRRRIINTTLVLCALQIIYLTIWGADTRLNETLALGAYTLAGAVIGAYVFGAAWEDIRMKDSGSYGGGYSSYPTTFDDRPR